jgi:hypothetical protein
MNILLFRNCSSPAPAFPNPASAAGVRERAVQGRRPRMKGCLVPFKYVSSNYIAAVVIRLAAAHMWC